MKLLYCEKCGWWQEVEVILFSKCKRCGNPLIIDDIEADEKLANELEKGLPISDLPFDYKEKVIELKKEFTIVRNTKIEHIKFKREKDHKKFEKMGKITNDEAIDFLIDLYK